MFGFRIDLNRRSSDGILRSGLLRDNGLGRLCKGGCTFLFLDHLSVSRHSSYVYGYVPAEKLPPPPKTV
jgi:hypothetical protein